MLISSVVVVFSLLLMSVPDANITIPSNANFDIELQRQLGSSSTVNIIEPTAQAPAYVREGPSSLWDSPHIPSHHPQELSTRAMIHSDLQPGAYPQTLRRDTQLQQQILSFTASTILQAPGNRQEQVGISNG